MLSPFSCGFFHHEDVDEESTILSPSSTPRKSTRRSSKDSKNPYSSRGLDKFSALLADLEEKRQKIYAQTPPQDISLLRFMFKDSNETADPIPIVVKLKDNRREDINNNNKIKTNEVDQQNQVVVKEKLVTTALEKFTIEPSTPTKVGQQTKSSKRAFSSSDWINFMNLGMWSRPSYYLPVVLVFILILLAVFGRSVAILCTSIGWYALPTLKETSSKHTRRSSKKKAHVTKLSDNNKMTTEHHGLSSPKSNKTAPGTPRSQQHGHRKSW